MKNFELKPAMLTMGGVFYPKGHMFIMFPEAVHAEQVAHAVDNLGLAGVDVMLLSPDVVLRDIGKVEGHDATPLPSVGTEGFTVHRYVDLARQGHHALMILAPSDASAEKVMEIVREVPFSYGQRYHLLAMEDLE
jgi:hypothetical protein